MEKLTNWNDWCNDKVLLHSEGGFPVLLSPNAVLGLEQTEGLTQIALVDGIFFEVKETVEEILAIISDLIKESNARREAQAAAQKAQYEEMMKEQQKASEGK